MDQQSRAWARALTLVVAVVIGLFAVALPASAAPSTKNYTASLSFGTATGVQSVTVPFGVPSNVKLALKNQPDSQQSFGSAQLDFAGASLPSAVSVSRPGWTVQKLTVPTGARYRVLNSGSLNPVPAGISLDVTVGMPGTPLTPLPGTTVATRVKQSNDFNGTNNDFTLIPSVPPATLTIVTTGQASTPCPNTCTPNFTSDVNGVRADLTVTSTAGTAFTYIAGFTENRLSCDTIPFGTTVKPEPFLVETDRTTPVSKNLVLTFPKALANLVPDNGTPHLPVCAGADVAFPGSASTQGFPVGTFTYPQEGLLLDCSDPAYVQPVAAFNADPNPNKTPLLPMCVSSRARNAGNLIVTIRVESTRFDPRFW